MAEFTKLLFLAFVLVALALALKLVGEPIPIGQSNEAFQMWIFKVGLITGVAWFAMALAWTKFTGLFR